MLDDVRVMSTDGDILDEGEADGEAVDVTLTNVLRDDKADREVDGELEADFVGDFVGTVDRDADDECVPSDESVCDGEMERLLKDEIEITGVLDDVSLSVEPPLNEELAVTERSAD